MHEVLVNHADAHGNGPAGRTNADGLVFPEKLAFIGCEQTVKHVHQGGFAGAVFPEQSVYLARKDFEIEMVIGDYSWKALGEIFNAEKSVQSAFLSLLG
jgi:hypothetical protein